MVALFAGLAGLASAQPQLVVATSPAGPIAYGQPINLIANISSYSNCGGVNIDFFEEDFALIGSATAIQTSFPPAPPLCIAIVTPNGETSRNLNVGTHFLTAGANCSPGPLGFPGCQFGTNTNYTLVVTLGEPFIVFAPTPNPSMVGQPVTLTVTVSPPVATLFVPTGTVNFFDGAGISGVAIASASVSNGAASATVYGLKVGAHILSAGYSGDSNYLPTSSNTVTQTVNPQPATTIMLTTLPNPSIAGSPVMLNAAVSPANGPTGNVTFSDNGGFPFLGPVTLSNGTASAQTTALTPGMHKLTASYGGDLTYQGSISSSVNQTVNQIAPATSLQAAPNPSTPGQNVVLTAGVSPSTATGTVTFKDGSNIIGAQSLNNGVAIFSTSSLSIGTHTLTAYYGGDINDAPSSSPQVTETVSQSATITSLQAAPASSSPGQNVVLTAAVSPSTASGTVTFLDGPTTIGAQSLNNGAAIFSTSSLSVGSHSLTASYFGDANDAPSVSPPVTESVGQTTTTTALAAAPNPSAPSQNVTLTATVTPASATGTVSFLDGASPLGTRSLSNGVATFSTTSLTTGTHSLTASYPGDTNDTPSVSPPVTQTVGQQTTTTALASAPNPSNPGQNVTLTATVMPSNATGTVSFFDGATMLGTGSLNGGVAIFSTTSLSAGSHSLTASYSGDTNNALSTSPAVNQSVTAAGGRSITSLVPSTAAAGSAAFTLTVNGAGFSSGALVQWNGALLGTTFVSATQVTAVVPANLIASPGMVTITVVTGGGTTGGATFLVSPAGSPEPVSVTPSSGSGTTQGFAFQFSDPAGYQTLGVVNVLIDNFLDGRNACYLAYVVSSNTLVVVDDGGDAGGPYAGSVALGGSATIQNSQCAVTLASAVGSGNTLTLFLNITFKPAFGGNKVMYMAARDLGAGNSNWQALGVWQTPLTPPGTIAVTGLIPDRGAAPSGTSQEFFVTLTDSKGASDFGVVNVLINNFIDGRQACYLAYAASTNTLILIDDAGEAAGPYAGSMALNGGPGTIQNSQCMVSGSGSAVNSVSNTLTLTLNITFRAAFAGNRVIYAAGRDSAGGNNTDWQAMGTTTVQ